METQLCVYNEKVSSLQEVITSLRQQLVLADQGVAEKDQARQEMLERLDYVQAERNAELEKVWMVQACVCLQEGQCCHQYIIIMKSCFSNFCLNIFVSLCFT